MKKRYWFLIVAIIVVGVIVAGRMNKGEELAEVTVEKAQRGDITSTVTATGKVFPEVEVKISSEVAGEIVELPVRDGQVVAKGDLLVRVNPDTLEAQVMQQEAALRAAQANAAEAKARMLQAELDLKRLNNLYEKGFATLEQVNESETQHEISKASYQATISRIEQQQMSLQEARNFLDKAATYSPIDGTVTALAAELGDRVVGTGQFEGTEIMRVADLSQMEIQVDVSEADIVSVKIGDEASVEIEALPNRKFAGEVTEIANSASKSEQSSQDQLTTFQVKVRLLEPSEEIRPGMTATADIKTKTVKGVVKVPLQAVTVRSREEVAKQLGEAEKTPAPEADAAASKESEQEGRPGNSETERGKARPNNLERVVFLFQDGKAELVRVETGLADNRSIEIKSGVSEGDEIISGGYRVLTRELEDGKAVTRAENKADERSRR